MFAYSPEICGSTPFYYVICSTSEFNGASYPVSALCWIGFVLVFFTFSTTQEYYSMPCYPALALLLGSAMAEENSWAQKGSWTLGAIAGAAGLACLAILFAVQHLPTPGDITAALAVHPNSYKLSLGHMEDLTLNSFAYLRLPLAIAGIGFMLGSVGTFVTARRNFSTGTYLAAAALMIVFFQAARLAMVKFDPLLSSHELAMAIVAGPPGQLIVDHHYYTFSSVAYYTGEQELLLNGRWNNFEYGSNAPDVPDVFLDDEKLKVLWNSSQRYYLVAKADQVKRFDRLLGPENFEILRTSGGKILMTNQVIDRKLGLPGN